MTDLLRSDFLFLPYLLHDQSAESGFLWLPYLLHNQSAESDFLCLPYLLHDRSAESGFLWLPYLLHDRSAEVRLLVILVLDVDLFEADGRAPVVSKRVEVELTVEVVRHHARKARLQETHDQ